VILCRPNQPVFFGGVVGGGWSGVPTAIAPSRVLAVGAMGVCACPARWPGAPGVPWVGWPLVSLHGVWGACLPVSWVRRRGHQISGGSPPVCTCQPLVNGSGYPGPFPPSSSLPCLPCSAWIPPCRPRRDWVLCPLAPLVCAPGARRGGLGFSLPHGFAAVLVWSLR
jgi:hypothetical protein